MAKTIDATKWLTLASAAQLAHVGRTTMHSAIVRGELPVAWTPHGRLLRAEDVEAWARRRETRRAAA